MLRNFIGRCLRSINGRRKNFFLRESRLRKAEISVADLLFCNSKNSEILRYDIIVRYLAIREYKNGSDRGFALYRKMQDLRMGKGFSVGAEERFKALISSYNSNGYDKSSCIKVDRNLSLIDGSHRIALAIYYGYNNISVAIAKVDVPISYAIDWFIENGFTKEEIDWILQTGQEVLRKTISSLSCVIWAPGVKYADSILEDLQCYGNISNAKKYSYKPEEYKNIVRAIYKIDDIEQWKIEKKLEHMTNYEPEIVTANLTVRDPAFRIKAISGMPLSTLGERIKKTIRSKYKNKISNYFFDIILHIGDNFYQSNYMRSVFETGIDFTEILDVINAHKYALAKVETPYLPEQFPDKIPVGKDVDVLCKKEDADIIAEKIIDFCKRNFNDYEVKVVKNASHGIQIRILGGYSNIPC